MLEWDRLLIVPLLQGVIGPEKGALGEERFLFKKNSLLHTSQCKRRGKAFIFVANVYANGSLPVCRRVRGRNTHRIGRTEIGKGDSGERIDGVWDGGQAWGDL